MLPHQYISGVISQVTVLPFGLALVLRVFRLATAISASVNMQPILNPTDNDEPDRASDHDLEAPLFESQLQEFDTCTD